MEHHGHPLLLERAQDLVKERVDEEKTAHSDSPREHLQSFDILARGDQDATRART